MHSHRDSDTGYYVYAVARAQTGRDQQVMTVDGIAPGVPVFHLTHRDLRAVVSSVSIADFGPTAIDDHLQNPNWLGDRVIAHQRVLDSLLPGFTMVPFKFCTIYASEDRVRDMLVRNEEYWIEILDRLDGAAEWGVKVFCDRDFLIDWVQRTDHEIDDLRNQLGGASTGAAYLLQRRIERAAQKATDCAVDCCIEATTARLGALARQVVTNPVQSPEAHRREMEMVLNAAFLVDGERLAPFRTSIKNLDSVHASQGFQFELTGPWPPYNFSTAVLEST